MLPIAFRPGVADEVLDLILVVQMFSSITRSFKRSVCRQVAETVRFRFPRRYLANPATPSQSHPNDNSISDRPKPKPKATTPLRRTASASIPIRSNPTPTRGDIQTVFTLATAEQYRLSRLRGHPDLPARSQTLHESWWVPKWGPKDREGEIFVFSNGSFVCWGLEENDAKRFRAEVIDQAPGIEVSPLREVETEELEFVVDPIELGGTCFCGNGS